MAELKNARVLVTGGYGFLGQAVVRRLGQEGCDIIAPLGSHVMDLRSEEDAFDILKWDQPDVVIHCAANCGGIGLNQKKSAELFRDNTLMGVNLIHACHEWSVKRLVVIGSVCAYPQNAPVPMREEDLWNGLPEPTNAAYGVAKRHLEMMLRAYWQDYKLSSAYLLITNLYGPGDNFDLETSHVIPAVIRKMHEAGNDGGVTLWGDGTPTRDFLYVEDAADAIVRAAKSDVRMTANIGSGQEVSILQTAYSIAIAMDFDGDINWDTSKPNGQPRRMLDTTIAEALLGWKAQTGLFEGLDKTCDWYKANEAASVYV